MEITPEYGPGGTRFETAVTSAAQTVFDLAAFANRYVELECDQAVYACQSPDDTTSMAVSGSSGTTGSGPYVVGTAVEVGVKLAANTKLPLFVTPGLRYLKLRAQSTSTAVVILRPASSVHRIYG